jgi:hypothetical protein
MKSIGGCGDGRSERAERADSRSYSGKELDALVVPGDLRKRECECYEGTGGFGKGLGFNVCVAPSLARR